MRLLFLGGTRFLGRHGVAAALARGHDVTVFTRGRAPSAWTTGVRHLQGNRDPRVEPGLAALGSGEWDAVIDTSGYLPRCVRAGADLLASRVGHYTFVSSMSVYADASWAAQDEAAPLASLDDPASEDVPAHYGALKARCEAEVAAAFGPSRTLAVRPGLIVGPHDPTDRFGYWVARFLAPGLLGDRGTEAVVPAPPERPVQFIDARDLATWMLDLVEAGAAGAFNASSEPGRYTMGGLVDALLACAKPGGRAPRPVWIADGDLAAAGVEPWTGLPLWLPADDPTTAGFMSFDTARAHGAGLRHRPLADTVNDTAEWLRQRDNAAAWANVLTAAGERAIVDRAQGRTG
jgi:2'-hydroxyisoflavone reductase